MGRDPRYHGETCPKCGSDYSYIVTTTPRDDKGKLIRRKHRWQCQEKGCNTYFLVNPR